MNPGNLLVWDERRGLGVFPVDRTEWPYDHAYFERYRAYDGTEIERRLTDFRLGLARASVNGSAYALLDVGVGSGRFVAACRDAGIRAFGNDVNPEAIAWLAARDLFRKIGEPVEVATFWDSLEHMPRPDVALAAVQRIAIVSLPIFRDESHARRSKHFRPTEHYWYFTRDGFVRFMWEMGFALIDILDTETQIGREDIMTFVFRRRAVASLLTAAPHNKEEK